jgi:hypothetical protein
LPLRLQATPQVGGGSAFFVRRTHAMKNIHIFSPDKDRKIARYCSVIIMALAWLFLAALFIWLPLKQGLQSGFSSLGSLEWEAYCLWIVYLFVLVMIPVQMVRYFRDKRPRR